MADIDYNEEYKNYTRCYKCNRKTGGKEDYKSVSLKGNVRYVRSCLKCRHSVNKSSEKHRPLSKNEKNRVFEEIFKHLSNADDTLKKQLNNHMKDIMKNMNNRDIQVVNQYFTI